MTAIDPEGPPLIGVDVGGTHVRVGLVQGERVTWEHRAATHFSRHCRSERPAESRAFVRDALAQAVAVAREQAPDAVAVGLALPGFFDVESGRLRRSPNLPGLIDVDVAALLAPCVELPVFAENDALAAAWGEYRLHPECPPSLVYVGLGTGVGGGLVLEGRPYRGGRGYAMEIGHVLVEPEGRRCGCGSRGCLERYASATGIRESYVEAGGPPLEAHEIAARARAGEAAAGAAFARAGTELARVLAHLAKTIDVRHVVIGGGVSGSWDLLEPAFTSRFEDDILPGMRGHSRVRVSTCGDRAGMLGAAWLAAESCRPSA